MVQFLISQLFTYLELAIIGPPAHIVDRWCFKGLATSSMVTQSACLSLIVGASYTECLFMNYV